MLGQGPRRPICAPRGFSFVLTLGRETLGAVVRLILNVIWFVLAGLWIAIGYAIAALIMFILIITIPFGVAALRIGIFALWPFGKTVIRRAEPARARCSAT